jgi:ribosomal protein S18 acetylase RimI-like enzyme
MEFTIRRAAPSDAAALAELAARTFRDTFAPHNDPEDLALHLTQAYGLAQQAGELVDPAITTLLVDRGGVLAGYAQLRRGPAPECVVGPAPIELWRFYIAREHHGQGLAQRLMHQVEVEAERAQARTLWLGVWEHNERAKKFYVKHRFVDVGSHVFTLGSDPQTDRLMARPLP